MPPAAWKEEPHDYPGAPGFYIWEVKEKNKPSPEVVDLKEIAQRLAELREKQPQGPVEPEPQPDDGGVINDLPL